MFAYAGKMLFVNLTTGAMEDCVLDETLAKNFLGGPGLGARILYENMPAHTDPFAEESMVGFLTGPMNNTGGFFGGRYTVVSKSPVTGGWNDANSGGFFGPGLKFDYSKSGAGDMMGVICTEICNSGGFCLFGMSVTPADSYQKLLQAATGFTYTPEEYAALGTRMYYMRHAFNLREGMDRSSFTLSKRFTIPKPPFEGPLKDEVVPAELLADNFFEAMHLDKETLIPEKEYLEAIGGLELVEKDLY